MKVISYFLLLSFTLNAAETIKPAATINLWPGKAPNEPATPLPPEKTDGADPAKKSVLKITNVSTPRMDIYPAPSANNSGAFVLVAPGGGYNVVCAEHEGTEVAAWLNKIGIGAAVLTYRVPRREGVTPDYQPMVQDAQRALGIIRSKAKEWNLDDKKIGMLGFSAGGHLTAAASTMSAKRMYDAVDDADKLSAKPDFAVLIYPGGMIEKDSGALKPDFKITKDTPPSFLIHASNDSSENSIAYYRALKAGGVPAELHLYAAGGHGFALRGTGPVAGWPKSCEEWLKQHAVIK